LLPPDLAGHAGVDFYQPHFQERKTAMTLTENDLRQFSGTEHWYRHSLVRNVLYTDGAKHVADEGGAYWLLDEIAFAQQFETAVIPEPFQVWKLTVTDDSGELTCEDGNHNRVFAKRIPYTDFPLPEITLWFTDNTILLPSEY
jgi:hypothetical protein